jgi:hypothetical protein
MFGLEVALWILILEVLDSNPDSDTGSSGLGFHGFPQSSQENALECFRLNYNRLLQIHFQFIIICLLSKRPTIYICIFSTLEESLLAPQKRCYSVMCQNAVIFIVTAVRTSNVSLDIMCTWTDV